LPTKNARNAALERRKSTCVCRWICTGGVTLVEKAQVEQPQSSRGRAAASSVTCMVSQQRNFTPLFPDECESEMPTLRGPRDKADNKVPTLFAIQQPRPIQPPPASRFLAFRSQLCCQWLGLPIIKLVFQPDKIREFHLLRYIISPPLGCLCILVALNSSSSWRCLALISIVGACSSTDKVLFV